MPNTFELIASSTVGAGGAASIDFTSIPSTYTDLCLKVSARVNQTASYGVEIYLTLNGSSSSQNMRRIIGEGSGSPYSTNVSDLRGVAVSTTQTSNTFSNVEFYLPNYSGSNYKSLSVDAVPENNASTTFMFLGAGLWQSTAAISSMSINCPSYTFQQYSTAYLYGVKNA